MPDDLEERGPAPGDERAEAFQVTADAVAPHDGRGVQENVLAGDQSLDHGPPASAYVPSKPGASPRASAAQGLGHRAATLSERRRRWIAIRQRPPPLTVRLWR